MALSVVDLYAKILPRTNCRDCGFPTCIAFAGMVVSEKLPLKNCPHIDPDLLEPAQRIGGQLEDGKSPGPIFFSKHIEKYIVPIDNISAIQILDKYGKVD